MARICTILICSLFSFQAAAGVIRGEVTKNGLAQIGAHAKSDQAFWRLGPQGEQGSLPAGYVVLEGEAATNLQVDAPPSPEVLIEGYGFWPALTVVRVGSSLTFRNLDPRAYSCQAKGGSDAFTIKELKNGATHEQKFLANGVLHLTCDKYPFMRATILVVESPLLSNLEPSGTFTMKNVPKGVYKLRLFANGKWYWQQSVHVSQTGTTTVALGDSSADQGSGSDDPADQKPETNPAKDVPPPVQPPAADKKPPVVDKKPPQADKKPPKVDKNPPKVDNKPPKADKKPPKADKKPPKVDKKPPKADKKPPKADKKPPAENKKPPKADKKPPKKDPEPAFKDVEPEIEIEIED